MYPFGLVQSPPSPPLAFNASDAPVISVFDYSPKTGVTKEDVITFTVVAKSPRAKLLRYTWTSTKGTLSANTGLTAGWRPKRADGTLEPGSSTVMLVVSDGELDSVAAVNIQISADGHVTVGPPAPIVVVKAGSEQGIRPEDFGSGNATVDPAGNVVPLAVAPGTRVDTVHPDGPPPAITGVIVGPVELNGDKAVQAIAAGGGSACKDLLDATGAKDIVEQQSNNDSTESLVRSLKCGCQSPNTKKFRKVSWEPG